MISVPQTTRMRQSPRTRRWFPMVKPSERAMKRIRAAIRERTTRQHFTRPPKEVIADVNRRVRGWVQYFHYQHCTRDFTKLRWYLTGRIRTYLLRRRGRRPWTYAHSDEQLYAAYGLYKIPTRAPWKEAHANAYR